MARADPVVGRPEPLTGRFLPSAYAVAIYLITLGIALIVLDYGREPIVGKEYLHGVLFGCLLMFLGSPLLFLARFPLRLAARASSIALVLWAYAFLTAIVLSFPLDTIGLLLERLPEQARPFGAGLAGLLVAIGVHVLISGAVTALLDLVIATVFLVRRGYVVALGRAALVGLLASAAVTTALFAQPAAAWRFPPLTLDPRISVGSVIVAMLVSALARPGSATADISAQISGGALSVRLGATTPWIAALIIWFAVAPLVAPHGWEPPALVVYATPGYEAFSTDDVTVRALRETEQRTGIAASDDRLLIIYRGPDGTRFTSRHSFYPDANVLISIDASVPPGRREYVLRFQIANSIIQVADPGIYSPLRIGYAYWSANYEFSPFVTGIHSGESPAAACADLPSTDVDALPDEAIELGSVPFVVAERQGGVDAAQRLFRSLLAEPLSAPVWSGRLADACSDFLAHYADPPLPELIAEPHQPVGLPLGVSEMDILRNMKARTGMDGRGHTFVIRYAPLSGDRGSESTYPDDATVLIVISQNYGPAVQRMSIGQQLAAAFVTIKYGPQDPVRTGFAVWASPPEPDPLAFKPAPPDAGLCAQRSKYPLDGGTTGAAYLASLPFVVAERDGGIQAAQRLLRETIARGGHVDVRAWDRQVAAACAALH